MTKKTIVIVGGSGSIGSAIARKISSKYNLILIARNEKRLVDLSKEIGCSYKVANIFDHSYLNAISSIKDDIIGFAYCLGSINLKSIINTTSEDYLESFNINVLSAIKGIKLIVENLKKNNGSILLFSTIAAKKGFSNHSIVSTSKAAIEGLTISLAAELSPEIRVNCIAPSIVVSDMTKKIIQNEMIANGIAKKHPIPRLGKGDDFGSLGAYLLNEEDSWITGQIFAIDGGRSTIIR